MNRSTSTLRTLTASLALLTTLALAQPSPSTPGQTTPGQTTPAQRTPGQALPGQPGMPGSFGMTSYREAEHAGRAIEKASREGYELEYLAQGRQLAQPELLEYAGQLLQDAQGSYAGQDFFAARQQAEATDKLYKAARRLYQAEGVLPLYGPAFDAGPGRGRGPRHAGRGSLEAPYQAQEELYLLARELDYYQADSGIVLELQTLAQSLFEQGGTQPAYGDGVTMSPFAYAEAAKEVAKAARHLVAAERGF